MKCKISSLLCLLVLLFVLCVVNVHAEDVTGKGNPFMTISPNMDDTSYFATGGPDPGYLRMTDGDNASSHDTWEGDNTDVNFWLYDGIGMQFPSGINSVVRFEWDVQVFGDGGWYDTLDQPLEVQVATDSAFGSYALIPGSIPGADGIWMTVGSVNNYPLYISGNAAGDPGVPADGSSFVFEFDFPGTIYGIRIIGDAGGFAGADGTGFVAAEEIRILTGDNMTRATAVSPAQGNVDVVVADAKLLWNPAQEGGVIDPNVAGHYVYIGTDPNGVRVSGSSALPVGTTSFVPTLEKDTFYYWHVDELLDDGTVLRGYVYTFQTELSLPLIDAQPQDIALIAGRDAVFSVSATDPLGGTLTYQWYFDADVVAGGEIALVDGADYSGTTTEELTVFAIESSDQGYYYCVIDNGSTIATVMARLTEGKLIAHWTMDGDPNDVTGNYPGVSTGEPVYETGKLGQAIRFDGVDDFITLPAGFEDFTTGLTISLWAKPMAVGNWARFIDIANGAASDNILFARGGTSNQLVLEAYNGAGGGAVWSPNVMELNVWQMLTGTMDSSGKVTLYRNGVEIATGGTNVPNVLTRSSNFIGKSNWPDALYAGYMDDIRLYNYALTAQEVADIYLLPPDVDFVCTEPVQFDLNDDCILDLNDFAIMAQAWLECGRYPTCVTEIP